MHVKCFKEENEASHQIIFLKLLHHLLTVIDHAGRTLKHHSVNMIVPVDG
jgi:hypothetical protein